MWEFNLGARREPTPASGQGDDAQCPAVQIGSQHQTYFLYSGFNTETIRNHADDGWDTAGKPPPLMTSPKMLTALSTSPCPPTSPSSSPSSSLLSDPNSGRVLQQLAVPPCASAARNSPPLQAEEAASQVAEKYGRPDLGQRRPCLKRRPGGVRRLNRFRRLRLVWAPEILRLFHPLLFGGCWVGRRGATPRCGGGMRAGDGERKNERRGRKMEEEGKGRRKRSRGKGSGRDETGGIGGSRGGESGGERWRERGNGGRKGRESCRRTDQGTENKDRDRCRDGDRGGGWWRDAEGDERRDSGRDRERWGESRKERDRKRWEERDRGKDRREDRGRHDERHRKRDRDWDRDKDRRGDRERHRDRERYREGRHGERDKDRWRDRDKGRDRNRGRDEDRDKEEKGGWPSKRRRDDLEVGAGKTRGQETASGDTNNVDAEMKVTDTRDTKTDSSRGTKGDNEGKGDVGSSEERPRGEERHTERASLQPKTGMMGSAGDEKSGISVSDGVCESETISKNRTEELRALKNSGGNTFSMICSDNGGKLITSIDEGGRLLGAIGSDVDQELGTICIGSESGSGTVVNNGNQGLGIFCKSDEQESGIIGNDGTGKMVMMQSCGHLELKANRNDDGRSRAIRTVDKGECGTIGTNQIKQGRIGKSGSGKIVRLENTGVWKIGLTVGREVDIDASTDSAGQGPMRNGGGNKIYVDSEDDDDGVGDRQRDVVVTYKKNMLTREDLMCLQGSAWLNDQVINVYGEMLANLKPDEVYYFTSFFYSHLKRRGYDGVKRWTKKVSVFSRRLLLLPLHLGLHWALGVVRLQTHEISLYDSAPSPATTACLTIMSRYLTEEAKARDRPDLKGPWSIHLPKNLPRQMNGNDCGVFVLEYCRCLVLDRPFSFSQADIPRIRRRIFNEIQEGVIAVDK
ncbi:uncharacterized protein LOC116944605 [Petromyzon marinus]|uniref:uncharacterized protein LOC116944605 n=1 Tax=Petromyzon marinus TaxID=7757 RepID=UPI003F71CC9F